jgi:hypothetical protein
MYSRDAEDLPERFGKEERLRWAWDGRGCPRVLLVVAVEKQANAAEGTELDEDCADEENTA